jgi:hypothetical protein
MNKAKIMLKIVRNSKEVKSIRTDKTRKIFHFLKAEDFQNCQFIVSVKYSGGGSNEGIYQTKKEVINALKMFLEI